MYADPSLANRIESRVARLPFSGCWIWEGTIAEKTGYGQISVNSKTTSAHRASFVAHKGEIRDGLHVCHTCDVRCCVNPDHLFLGTRQENQADMARKMRSVFGSKNGRAKVTREQITEIRNSSLSQRKLALIYGVSQSQMQRIKSHQCWVKG